MTEIIVRPATLEDVEFLVSGNANMALETEARTLDTRTLRTGVCAVFDDPARGFYLIAEIDGQPVGQMMIICGLRLYVESHNQRAQGAYLRCGMSEAIYRMFEVDYSATRPSC